MNKFCRNIGSIVLGVPMLTGCSADIGDKLAENHSDKPTITIVGLVIEDKYCPRLVPEGESSYYFSILSQIKVGDHTSRDTKIRAVKVTDSAEVNKEYIDVLIRNGTLLEFEILPTEKDTTFLTVASERITVNPFYKK